jgi:hypothetical protein
VTSSGIFLAVMQATHPGDISAIQCPAAIEVKEALAKPVVGWSESASPDPHPLAGVTIFDGKPEERASLVGTEKNLSKAERQSTWDLALGRAYWLSCSYANSSVVLSRPIDKTARACVAVYARTVLVGGLPELRRFSCK